uniref:Reverse transcriptase Ty1/copia-type domain-containing protein n=1 Tax=Solanum lycopersicum TaxID=4081 RepID=A0A3Q7EDZ2_SOLLC
MKDLDPLHLFLGVVVKYFDGSIQLRQSKYVAELIDNTEMTFAKVVATPLAQKHGLHESVGSLVETSFYRMIVESLQYLTLTRPDITHVVNLASQFVQNPKNGHLQGVKRIFSAEAEYRALASTSSEMTWIMHLLHDLVPLIESEKARQVRRLWCHNLGELPSPSEMVEKIVHRFAIKTVYNVANPMPHGKFTTLEGLVDMSTTIGGARWEGKTCALKIRFLP